MKNRLLQLMVLIAMLLFLTGCSRAEINRQVAESIGTLGMYENNEPVQTPKMQAQQEMKELKDSIEANVMQHVDQAAELASHYDYQAALDELAMIDENYQDDERVLSAKVQYSKLVDTLYPYDGNIVHFSVENLVVDENRAFNDPEMGGYYNYWSLTVGEFKKILNELYKNNFVLADIREVAVPSEDKDGNFIFEWDNPIVPEGKYPFILSFTGSSYDSENAKYGFAEKMVLDGEGNVKNQYVDASGNTLIGAYDAVAIVDEFVEEHPDFSLHGAKGLIAVSGSHGIFGYDLETDGDTIKSIADKLKSDGWQFACSGYRGVSMENELTGDEFISDMKTWKKKVSPLVGETDMIIFPNGDQIAIYGYKHMWAMKRGYRYYFSQWSTANHLQVYDDYMEQSRRMLDGYDLYFYGENMATYFDYKKILSNNRPAFE